MTSTQGEAPLFYIVNQHIGWLKQYVLGMDDDNWRDMRLRAERQLDGLSEEIDKIAAVQSCDAESGWLPLETAPHETRVLLGWLYDGSWFCETGMATHGWRRGAYSTMSQHGQATHWMPLPAGPPLSSADRGTP